MYEARLSRENTERLEILSFDLEIWILSSSYHFENYSEF